MSRATSDCDEPVSGRQKCWNGRLLDVSSHINKGGVGMLPGLLTAAVCAGWYSIDGNCTVY